MSEQYYVDSIQFACLYFLKNVVFKSMLIIRDKSLLQLQKWVIIYRYPGHIVQHAYTRGHNPHKLLLYNTTNV